MYFFSILFYIAQIQKNRKTELMISTQKGQHIPLTNR